MADRVGKLKAEAAAHPPPVDPKVESDDDESTDQDDVTPPATEPAEPAEPAEPHVDRVPPWIPQPTRHYYVDNNPIRLQMPTSMMPRPAKFNTSGKPATIHVNSHRILSYPKHTIYQYDVSPCRNPERDQSLT